MVYYYSSNYPSNSGPPPPGMPFGYGYPQGGMLAGAFNGGYPSQGGAYGIPSPYQDGANAYYFGQQQQQQQQQSWGSPYQYGDTSQTYTSPQVPAYSGVQQGPAPVEPPPPPPSMLYGNMQDMMATQSSQQTQWNMYKKMGLIEPDPDEEEEDKTFREKIRKRDTKQSIYEEEVEEEEAENEEATRIMEERARRAEEQVKILQQKLDNDDSLKSQLRERFIEELLNRQEISGTFEETMGTVFPYDKYDKDDPVTVWYSAERGSPITGESWDPMIDSEYLRKAMRGRGTDEQAIIHVVTTRCNMQRNKMLKEYKTAYGRDLIKDLRSELSGDFRESILACFETPARYDAWSVKKAIYGAGTDEATLIEILMTRTNAQIKEMVEQYNLITYEKQKNPENSIERDVEDDTSGDFKRLMISACQGNRRLIERSKLEEAVEEVEANGKWSGMFRINYEKLCDKSRCKRFAQELFDAGEKKLGTDEETFNRIFSVLDYYSLRLVWDEYVKISQRDILNSVDRETSGDLKHGLRAIAQNAKCRPAFLAERLYKSMKGAGTDDSTLIRICISRSEIDMVQIKACFLAQYKQTLWNFIKDDTSGDYRRLLLTIVGKN